MTTYPRDIRLKSWTRLFRNLRSLFLALITHIFIESSPHILTRVRWLITQKKNKKPKKIFLGLVRFVGVGCPRTIVHVTWILLILSNDSHMLIPPTAIILISVKFIFLLLFNSTNYNLKSKISRKKGR